MSEKDVKEFIERLRTDPSMHTQLQGATSEAMFLSAAVRLGTAKGYTFTVEDLKAELDAARIKPDGGELTDAQLQAVAGGGLWEMVKSMLTIEGSTCSRNSGATSSCYSGTSRA